VIVYEATRGEFTEDVLGNVIEAKILDSFRRRLGHSTSRAEIEAWRNSMGYMNNGLLGAGIPADAGVAIEYRIPQTAKRVDFILSAPFCEAYSAEAPLFACTDAKRLQDFLRRYTRKGDRKQVLIVESNLYPS
jgi:hypothetical protein